MQTHFPPRRNGFPEHGMVLIFVAGILAILAAMGTAFFAISQSSTSAAVRYSDMVRADMLCRAGMAEAIVRLRNQAYIKTEDPGDNWFTVDYLRGLQGKTSFPFCNGRDDDNDGIVDNENETKKVYTRVLGESAGAESDRFSVEVSDAASKVNINAGDNLAVMLDNLCRVIGPPLVPANLDALQPRRWNVEADPTDPIVTAKLYDTTENANDTPTHSDLCYTLDANQRPILATDGRALYGDGYAIAGYRARQGTFRSIEDVKSALTYVERNGNAKPDDPLEQMEIAIKFAALRDHITIGSWVDTNTVCVGKFEWVHLDTGTGKTIAIDRDKSWVEDQGLSVDPLNLRGSLRGCYLSIMNGHGAGQLRRIRTNGIDWVEVDGGFAVTPGPISSYMIIAPEEALLMNVDGSNSSYAYPDNPPPAGTVTLPRTNADGTLVSNPKIDYSVHPLCIHRAPVNINTATDKVLAALVLGINVQHGHPQAVGTDTDVPLLRAKWKTGDPHKVQPYLLTPAGLKRIPAASGKPILNMVWGTGANELQPPPAVYDVAYINNHNALNGTNRWGSASTGLMNEAHELAYRIIMARQSDKAEPTLTYIDPTTGSPTATNTGLLRGPFRNYDDLYFRVVKPWDDRRFSDGAGHKARIATLVMANFNSNTDILKFNPNIEWIDRWSRNYTDQEPVMVYTNTSYSSGNTLVPFTMDANDVFTVDVAAATTITASSVPIYTAVTDARARGWAGDNIPPLKSSQKDDAGQYTTGAYITRSFRYKSDELLDKTDLNRSTTEFSFDSNGIFYVAASGQVINPITGQMLSERKLEALVKVYDVWRESTQQQFVMGTISKAVGNRSSSTDKGELSCTGQLARDASGLVERKGLITLPEPLLPLKAKIVDVSGSTNSRNYEAVSGVTAANSTTGPYNPLDAFGNVRRNPYDPTVPGIEVPEVLANRVLPARWDGQIVLSTNTSAYDSSENGDADSFLASFDGDTDTATCQGNGREQAKWPYSATPDPLAPESFTYTGEGYKYRCVQSIGLLGVLNDSMVSTDPGIPLVDGHTPFRNWSTQKDQVRWIYPFYGVSAALMPLSLGSDRDYPMYWNNLSLRMGALRTDGVYLTAPGVSGNTATLKYLFSPGANNYNPDSNARRGKLNYQPDSKYGNLITMWTKTVWHQDDNRNHEFFNPGNEARINQCEIFYFQKMGQYKWCSRDGHNALGSCGNRPELNDLSAIFTYAADSGYGTSIHGGFAGVIGFGSAGPDGYTYCADENQSYALPGTCDVAYGANGSYAYKSAQTGTITFNNGTFGDPIPGVFKKGYYRTGPPAAKLPESPAYRVQPFRWSYVGLRTHYGTRYGAPGVTQSVRDSNGPDGIAGNADDTYHNEPRPGPGESIGPRGHLAVAADWSSVAHQSIIRHYIRPFIDTQLFPECPASWPTPPPAPAAPGGDGEKLLWTYRGCSNWGDTTVSRMGQPRDVFNGDTSVSQPNPKTDRSGQREGEGQDVKWVWAEPYGGLALDPGKANISLKSFGLNNLNYGNPKYNQNFDPAVDDGTCELVWHYRHMPEDGTYAVIDELKISNRDWILRDPRAEFSAIDPGEPDWSKDRAYREMRTSRYYLPPSPGTRNAPSAGGPPTFTSQTLLQSLKGHDALPGSQKVAVVRVNWNAFAPRFMSEYQEPGMASFSRNERLTHFATIAASQTAVSVPFKGPFDYVRYNDNADTTAYSVNRPEPWKYTDRLTQASKGVEIELLQDSGGALTILDGKTFTNPAAHNAMGTLNAPVWCLPSQLRYRVRFRYPVDPLVDPSCSTRDVDPERPNWPCVNPAKHYLLDTPVFDDISVTYILPVRILDFHEATE
jgi:hypothetical protein